MTRRVLDTLHESVTDTHCGECPSQSFDDESGGLYCAKYGGTIGDARDDSDVRRCAACLAAESRAECVLRRAGVSIARSGYSLRAHVAVSRTQQPMARALQNVHSGFGRVRAARPSSESDGRSRA